jgi:prevent-host-death family protein
MNLTTDFMSVTELKTNAAGVLNKLNKKQRPLIITQNGEPRAVLQDPQTYENIQKTLTMFKLMSQSELDIKKGDFYSHKEVLKKFESKLKNRN